jgi:hypothetical protein
MGAGRRIARVAHLLSLSGRVRLGGKLRVGFWLTQDADGVARRELDRVCEHFADRIEPVVFDVTGEEFTRCLACDICPRCVGVDGDYRCVVQKSGDFFRRMHQTLIDVDALAPVAFTPREAAGLVSTYQRFNERTRYFRRGDYIFTDVGVAPFLVEEVGANDSLRLRILTSTIRQHTVMTRPIVAHRHEGRILNPEQVLEDWDNFIAQASRLTAGRLARSEQEMVETRYNPTGYVLSAAKDAEDEKQGKRRELIEDRTRRLREMAAERLIRS